MNKQMKKFNAGDRVVFLGSKESRYGYRPETDDLIGTVVTIKAVFPRSEHEAYLIKEDVAHFWYAENCFESQITLDLPEFCVAKLADLNSLLL